MKYFIMERHIEVQTTRNIAIEAIRDLLNDCAEGSRYWCMNSFELGYDSGTLLATKNGLGEGLILKDGEEDEKGHNLNLGVIQKGLHVMAKDYPQHFADFYSGDYDAVTSDCFLQCCLFGEVIYG